MALENKLGLTSSADLAREEERISKKKRLSFLIAGCLINWKRENSPPSKQSISISLMKSTILPENSEL